MDIIANKKIENLPFDKTILCTITAIKDKDEGIYEVSANTDSAQANRSYFQAFAQEGATYEVGDNVYINVPQNDFSNQKTIISKYISEQAKPVNYINPMEQFIKLEEINYTGQPNYGSKYGLKANSETQFQYEIFEKVYKLADMPKNYDCLGISADFTTLLGSYKPLDGEYGLRFEFGGLKDGWDTNISNDTDISNISKYLAFKEVTFSNREMYGMTYDFFTPSHQEKLINLQDFPYPIKIIRCYFYQNKNFRDINNNEIPGKNYEWDELNKTWKKPLPKENGEEQRYIVVDPDIQIDNLLCTFGYLMSDAKDGDLRLYTTSRIKYSEAKSENQNKKILKLRWLLNDENGNLKAIDELEDKVPEDDLTNYSWWENKIIYLYKYTYGKDEVDPYAGPFWERIASYGKYVATQTIREVELDNGKYKYKPESRLLQIFSSSRDPWGNVDVLNKGVSKFDKPFNIEADITNDDKNSVFARYKVIILEYTYPVIKNAASNPYTTSIQFDEEASDVVIEPEDVITEGNYRIIDETSLKIYESNEITFENENEVAGKAAMALINGLELECVDGSNGIYRIYGEDNKITAQTNSQSMKLRANFNAINILGLDAGEANITWYYPKNNTMFVSPIDKAAARIDVYKPVSVTLSTTTANLSSYYVKVNEQYYSLSSVTIKGTTAVGYTRDEQSYFKADSQTVYQKGKETVLAANWNENSDSDYYVLTQNLDNISRIGDSDSITPSNNEIVYTIDSFYASNRTNNTIKCKIERYGREYWAEKEFFFGHQGNNGTNYAFDISLERKYGSGSNPSAEPTDSTITSFLTLGDSSWVKVKPTLIYGKDEIDLSDKTITWEWYKITGGNVSANQHVIKRIKDGDKSCYIKLNTSSLDNYCAILHAQITQTVTFERKQTAYSGSDASDNPTKSKEEKSNSRSIILDAYLPIAVAASGVTSYEGATSILYDGQGGNPIYYSGEHKLFINNEEINPSWSVDIEENESSQYYPLFDSNEDNNTKILIPTPMFFTGLNKHVSIVATVDSEIKYVQPLLIMQNAYGNQTVNQWDGNLLIDADGNYILSAMLGAGKKDNQNRFSGVLLGDVGNLTHHQTGIYGYGKGVQTYGFREDGTAFIGASGKGRINFDGTNATITSGNYSSNSGMQIDLDDGKIDAYNFTLTAGSGNEQIIITSNNHKTKGKYDENPLTIGSKFSVAWDGTVTMSQAQIGGDWSGTGYAESSSKTIESILQALATNAKNADDATDAVVDDHWEPDHLYSRSIEWIDEQFIQQKNSQDQNLYWETNNDGDINTSNYSDIPSDYPYVELIDSNEVWQTNNSGKHLYFSITPSDSNTQTTPNSYPVVKENEAYTHFVLTNQTYGDATHKYILEKDGSLFAKNGIFSGIVSAYAGDLGGWVISPGLMSYGYKMKLIQNNDSYYWQGDFFGSNTSDATIDADPSKIGGASNDNKTTGINDDLTNTASSVSVGPNKAFIYLRNSGDGITINGFGDNDFKIPPYVTFKIEQNSYFQCRKDTFQNVTRFYETEAVACNSNIQNVNNGIAYMKISFKSIVGGTLKIYLNVNSQVNRDYLVLSKLDSLLTNSYNTNDSNAAIMISGNDDTTKEYNIEADTDYFLTIKYMKDSNGNFGSDMGQVSFTFSKTDNSVKNIIFSLGKNFAVDREGNLFAKNGIFNGTINATQGYIGGINGWVINNGFIESNDSKIKLFASPSYGNKLSNYLKNPSWVHYSSSNNNLLLQYQAVVLNRLEQGLSADASIRTYQAQTLEPILKADVAVGQQQYSKLQLDLLGLKGTIHQHNVSIGKYIIEAKDKEYHYTWDDSNQNESDMDVFNYGLCALNKGGYFVYSLKEALIDSNYNNANAWDEKYLVSSLTESLRVRKLRNIEFSDQDISNGALIVGGIISASIGTGTETQTYSLTCLKIASSTGSNIEPIYINSNGVPKSCSYTLGASVPASAKFTDTLLDLSQPIRYTSSGYKFDDDWGYGDLENENDYAKTYGPSFNTQTNGGTHTAYNGNNIYIPGFKLDKYGRIKEIQDHCYTLSIDTGTSLPTNSKGYLYNDGNGTKSWSSLSISTINNDWGTIGKFFNTYTSGSSTKQFDANSTASIDLGPSLSAGQYLIFVSIVLESSSNISGCYQLYVSSGPKDSKSYTEATESTTVARSATESKYFLGNRKREIFNYSNVLDLTNTSFWYFTRSNTSTYPVYIYYDIKYFAIPTS